MTGTWNFLREYMSEGNRYRFHFFFTTKFPPSISEESQNFLNLGNSRKFLLL